MEKPNLLDKLKLYSALTAGLVASGKGAEAAIVYTDINPDVTRGDNTNYSIDFNNDGTVDIRITQLYRVSYGQPIAELLTDFPTTSRVVRAATPANSANKLDFGTSIGPSSLFTATVTAGLGTINGSYPWAQGAVDKYMGVKFNIGSNVHYGWVQLTVVAGVRSYTIKAFAYENVPDKAISAGAIAYAPVPSVGAITVADVADNLSGADIKVDFVKPTSETGIVGYRVFVVPSASVASFTIAKAWATPAANYFAAAPTGADQSITLSAALKDADGNAISNGKPYKVFVLSVGDAEATSSLSTGSTTFTLSSATYPATSPTALSESNIIVSFAKASSEVGIASYRVLVVPATQADTFDLADAVAFLKEGNYFETLPDGESQSVTLPKSQTDINNEPLAQGGQYVIFVLSLGEEGFESALSVKSDPFSSPILTSLDDWQKSDLAMYVSNNTLIFRDLSSAGYLEIFNSAGTLLISQPLDKGDNAVELTQVDPFFIIKVVKEGKLVSRKMAKTE